jgi:transposase
MRTIGLDVHKRFAEVAVHEQGAVRPLGRVAVNDLPRFAATLTRDDHVVVESTSFTWALVELLSERAGRVTVSNPMRTKAIASAKVKNDKVDAKTLAELGAAGFLPEVWIPDAKTRALRQQLAHRASLVRQRTRLRNQLQAILARNFVDLPASDVFGCRGRRLLETASLPEHERSQLRSVLRLHDAVAGEVAEAERPLARMAFATPEVRLLMTIPGLGPITALSLLALIGDVRRFASARQLVGYLGLDPRVRQSGERAARMGHISRQGQAHARGLLTEAAHAAVRTPGPLRAFYHRVKNRRGSQIAIVATARKLTVLCWHLLTSGEVYRFEAPTLTRRKLRELQLKAEAPGPRIRLSDERQQRKLERIALEQAERHYASSVAARSRAPARA